ncbi:TPA: hypothetical protein ACH3X1_003688 [Trebouxia sp. C0004]
MLTSRCIDQVWWVKKTWLEKRATELCEMASKDPSGFWRAFKTQRHNVCPVELAAQFEAFRALMGPRGPACSDT